ncbi:MAG: tRNA lysidine(34) synthetase TilS, partial [Acidobacteriota bacterium]
MTIMTLSRFVAHFRACFPDLMGRRALVALSGGADSVALLVLLHQSMRELSLSLCAAHVHHHLRGEEADEDALWCAQLCERLRVPFAVLHLDEPTPPRGVSPEAWWRRERYRLLVAEAGRAGCAAVLTAHTLDDQAETVLLKLLTGAGPRGVAGIRPRAGVVVRPLLEVRRAELRDFLVSRGSSWREDATNQDPRRPRAWVRHLLLPLLEARFPRAGEHLAGLAGDVARDEELLGELLARQAPWPQMGERVLVTQLRQLPEALLARWTLQIASGLPLREPPSRTQLRLVSAMIHSGRPAAVDLGRRWVLRRHGDWVSLLPPPCPPFESRPAGGLVTLPGGWRATLGEAPAPRANYRVWLDPRILTASPGWRSPRRGEGWPEAGWKSLARALAAARVPAPWRAAWPVLEAGGRIVWVPAVGVA